MSQRRFQGLGRGISLCSAAILLALTLFVPAASVHAESAGEQPDLATVVRCDPTTATGVVGASDAVVDMYIEDVVGLYGVDLTISFFNTTIAQVLDQLPASGVQIEPLDALLQPDFPVRNIADNTAGTIRYAASQIDPSPPATGNGPVARITFQGLQAGTFIMTWGAIELSDINGVLIPFTAQPCTVTFTNPLAVTLTSFEVTPQADHILVAWETASEIGNRGFNLYRATTPAAPEQQLNDFLIPSQATGSGQGYAYTWQDFDVTAGSSYYYWLETVSISGATEMYGPVSATMSVPTAVTLASLQATPAGSVVSPILAAIVALAALTGAALGTRRR